MNFDLSGQVFYEDMLKERQANEFAEAMLFGAGQLAAAYTIWDGDICKIARYFGVTESVTRIAVGKLML